MNKDIKLLIESFFDDMFDEHDEQESNSLLGDDITGNINDQTNNSIVNALHEPMKLTDCKTDEDIITCFKENSKFIQWYEKNIQQIVYSLRSNKNLLKSRSITYIQEYMLNKFLDDTITIKHNEIIERAIFGLLYSYRFIVEKSSAWGHNEYSVYILYLQVHRQNMSYMPKIFVDILFVTDRNNDIVNDKEIFDEIKHAYRTEYKSMDYHIMYDIFPMGTCSDILYQIKHKPVVYPISKRDITIMSKSGSLAKLASFNNVNTVIPKICAYCIANDRLNLLEWNSTNLGKWSLGIHDMQYYINNMFNSPGAMCVYFKDLVASIKNYQDNVK